MAFADRRRALTGRDGRVVRGWACVRRGAMAMVGRALDAPAAGGLRLGDPAGHVRAMVVPVAGGLAPVVPMVGSRVQADRAAVGQMSDSRARGRVTVGRAPVDPKGRSLVRDVPATDAPEPVVLAVVGPKDGSPAADVPATGDPASAIPAQDSLRVASPDRDDRVGGPGMADPAVELRVQVSPVPGSPARVAPVDARAMDGRERAVAVRR